MHLNHKWRDYKLAFRRSKKPTSSVKIQFQQRLINILYKSCIEELIPTYYCNDIEFLTTKIMNF